MTAESTPTDVSSLRQCRLCGSLDAIERITARFKATDFTIACSYCGGNDFNNVLRLTRFQEKAVRDFNDTTVVIGGETFLDSTDAPIWRPGQG